MSGAVLTCPIRRAATRVAGGGSVAYAVLLSLAILLVAGCGSDDETAASPGPGSLVVYSGRSDDLVAPIIEQFKDTTGIDVKVKWGSTSEVALLILEEGDASPADVFFAQDPSGLAAVVDRLSTLPDDLLARVPDWARSPDGRWVGISGRARVVVYNTDRLDETDLPSSMEGFTDHKWKGRIGWPPSNGSFQAMVAAMRLMWGDERTRRWLQGIKANEPREYTKNTPLVAAVASGEIDVGFVNHYYLYRFIEKDGEGFGARNHHLADGGPGSIVLVAGAGILNTAKNSENAEKFLRFMLSMPSQQYFASTTFEYPLSGDVKTHGLLASLDEINNPSVDMASLEGLKETQAMLRDLDIIP